MCEVYPSCRSISSRRENKVTLTPSAAIHLLDLVLAPRDVPEIMKSDIWKEGPELESAHLRRYLSRGTSAARLTTKTCNAIKYAQSLLLFLFLYSVKYYRPIFYMVISWIFCNTFSIYLTPIVTPSSSIQLAAPTPDSLPS